GHFYFSANMSAPLLHILFADGHDAVTTTGEVGGRGGTATTRNRSWSSDPGIHAPSTNRGRSYPVPSAARRCSRRNGASISTTAASAICGPVTPAATSSKAK